MGRNVNWNLILKALILAPVQRGTLLLINFIIFGYINWKLFELVCVFSPRQFITPSKCYTWDYQG